MYNILVCDDDKEIVKAIDIYLSKEGYNILKAYNGNEALDIIKNNEIHLVVLDIMMPGIDGYEVCKQLRMKSSKPIIFISALQEEQNQLMAYDLGADDYITKPFKPSLLYAKCLAIIRRDKKVEEDIITFGKIKLDKINHLLIIDEKLQILANKEYELLSYLCQYEGRLLSREQILNHVWGYDYFGDGRAIDTYIKKLRKKLGKYSSYIQTVIKTGYM